MTSDVTPNLEELYYIQQPDWSTLTSLPAIQQALEELIKGIGFDSASLIYAPVGELPNRTPGPVHPLLNAGEYNMHWLKRWRERSKNSDKNPLSHELSPTWKQALQQTLPQRFELDQPSKWSTNLTLADQRWLNALHEEGFQELWVTPVHFPGREYMALSCLSHRNNPKPPPFSDQTQANLLYCVHRFAQICLRPEFKALRQLSAPPSALLSKREQECLFWAAQGKSAVETAAILALRPETVRTYLKALLRKLQAENKPQAIAIAYETGLLGNRSR
ncbi:helix-turn-helix transcriptional regulator [Oceanospirillum maris]|uniref:helix-turn-helix transcriptional regulator n=1 Tax=Oceanospirillum maris TaxID=64977 RepID=UPI0004139518|nr:LuxR family transcriptional regulator [Oceanospirillum maris]